MLTGSYPRLVPSFAALCLVGALAGCGGDDDSAGDADPPAATAAAGTGEPASTAAADGAAAQAATVEELLALASSAAPAGFTADPPTKNELADIVNAFYQGDGTMASVMLQPCDPLICWDLDGEITPEHEDNLKSTLSADALADPALVFEYGNVEPAPGYEAFYTYKFHFSREGGSASGANAYDLLYHDGRIWMMVSVQPEFGPLPETAEEFQAELDQATAASIAADVFATYTDGLTPVS